MRPSRLTPVSALAREAGVSRRTMARRLARLASSIPDGMPPFLVRVGGRWYVSTEHLRRAYPTLIEPHLASRDDVDLLRRDHEDLRRRVNGIGARVRAIETVTRGHAGPSGAPI